MSPVAATHGIITSASVKSKLSGGSHAHEARGMLFGVTENWTVKFWRHNLLF
jgi:hypothetical protein